MTSTEPRDFDLSDVLSITTGYLVSTRHMEGVHDILNFMTGDNLFTHALPRAAKICKPVILEQHPALAAAEEEGPILEAALGGGDPDDKDYAGKVCEAWVADLALRFGRTLSIRPIPPSAYQPVNPIAELAQMMGDGPESDLV